MTISCTHSLRDPRAVAVLAVAVPRQRSRRSSARWRAQSDGERRRTSRRCFKQAPRIEGRIDIPDARPRVLMQPAGRTWDYFHEVTAALGRRDRDPRHDRGPGARPISIMGRLRISAGRSGPEDRPLQGLRAILALADGGVLRHSRPDRPQHHLRQDRAAAADRPGGVLSSVSQLAKYVHNFTSFAFVVGLVLIIVLFFRDNLPAKGRSRLGQAGRRLHQDRSMRLPAGSMPAREAGLSGLSLGGRRCGHRCPVSCCCFPSTGPTSPRCRSRRSCTPSSPFCSSR